MKTYFSAERLLQPGDPERWRWRRTVIRLNLSLAGRTNTMTSHITEAEPGRVLVEKGSGVQTTFTVQPEAGHARVHFDTVLQAGGLEGLMNKLFPGRLLGPLYTDELQRLERYAQSQAVVAPRR